MIGVLLVRAGVGGAVGSPLFASSDSVGPPPERSSDKPVLNDLDAEPSGPTNTIPPPDRKVTIPTDVEGSLGAADRIIATEYASNNGLTLDEAARELIGMADMTALADEARKTNPAYAGFRITGHGEKLVGELALADEAVVDGQVDADTGFVLKRSRVAESEFVAMSAELTSAATSSGLSNVTAVTYDVFEDRLILWTDEQIPTTNKQATVPTGFGSQLADGAFSALADLPLTWESSRDSRQNHGGLKLISPASWNWLPWVSSNQCTTGFGAQYNGHNSELTAGHCAGNNWQEDPPWTSAVPVTFYWDRSVGGYQDRVFMENPLASYWTYTGSGTGWQDMSSARGHIYQGAYYCHYSRTTYGRRCSVIQGVNFPIQGVFTTYGQLGLSQCAKGDSGGPVFQPQLFAPYLPSGLIEGQTGNGICAYTALDDQFAGTGFHLL